MQDLVSIDVSALFWDGLTPKDVHAHHVVLVEALSPTLWDAVLHFVLDHHLVWALRKCLGQGLLVQLIELVVELSNHLLYIG